MDQTEAELESFRRRWREEVSARKNPRPSTTVERRPLQRASVPAPQPSKASVSPSASTDIWPDAQYDRDEVEPGTYRDLEEQDERRILGGDPSGHSRDGPNKEREPRSALEHYEKAVERESQGSLGDSVSLYRRAFRLDSKVHEAYKNKHFPPSVFAAKLVNPNPTNVPVTVPNTAHHSLHGLPASVFEMIQGFSKLSVTSVPPPTDASPPPLCPMANIPEEILVEILLYTAILDVASFARLAQVCKRLAYIVTTEEQIWKRVIQGHEFGFAAMHYRYVCDILGLPLADDSDGRHMVGSYESSTECGSLPAVVAVPLTPSYPSYRHMFRTRPRIRFNGCYISTVNYTRPGASSPTQLTWNSPVLIVTYYRYLRFFRDGTVISLLTTAEPQDVVHYLHKEYVHDRHTSSTLPSAVMKDVLRGRWRLSGDLAPADGEHSQPSVVRLGTVSSDVRRVEGPASPIQAGPFSATVEAEGDLHIETEGVVPKYMYKMQLGLSSAGRSTRNNKLVWKGYWSYNRLTDDWGEFGLKNDRAFYWSRVRSYASGL